MTAKYRDMLNAALDASLLLVPVMGPIPPIIMSTDRKRSKEIKWAKSCVVDILARHGYVDSDSREIMPKIIDCLNETYLKKVNVAHIDIYDDARPLFRILMLNCVNDAEKIAYTCTMMDFVDAYKAQKAANAIIRRKLQEEASREQILSALRVVIGLFMLILAAIYVYYD